MPAAILLREANHESYAYQRLVLRTTYKYASDPKYKHETKYDPKYNMHIT